MDHFAVVGLPWNHGTHTVVIGSRPLEGVEVQVGFAFVRVRTVAGEAVLRQQRADVAVVVDLPGSKSWENGKEQK